MTLAMRAMSVAFTASLHLLIARSMTPDTYAAIAMTQVLLLVFAMIADFGTETRLITEQNSAEQPRSLLQIPIITALAIAVLSILVSNVAEQTLEIKDLGLILAVSAVSLPLQAMQISPRARLYGLQRYRDVAFREMMSNGIAWIVAVPTLFVENGVWSFCVYVIVLNATRSILLWQSSDLPFFPSLTSGWRFREYLKGGSLFAIGAFNFFEIHYDDLIIAVNLGGAALSVYQLSYTVIMLQQEFVSGVMKRIALPEYVRRMRGGKRAVLSQFTFDTRFVIAISSPILVTVGLYADPLLTLLLNESWISTIPVFRILCLEALRQALLSLSAPVLLAIGLEREMLKFSRMSAIVLIVVFTALSFTNLLIFVIGYFAINSILNVYYFRITQKALNANSNVIISAWFPGFLAAIASISIWGFTQAFELNHLLMIASFGVALTGGIVTAAVASGEFSKALRNMASGLRSERKQHSLGTVKVYSDSAFSDYNPHLKSLHQSILAADPRFEFIPLHFRELLQSLPDIVTSMWLADRKSGEANVLHIHFPAFLYDGRSVLHCMLRAGKHLMFIALLRFAGFYFILTLHDERAHDFRHRKLEKMILYLLVQAAEQVITLSDTAEKVLGEKYGRCSGVSVTPHPVYEKCGQESVTRADARRNLSIQDDEIVLLLIGANKYYKGYDTAITALKDIDIRLTLICAGSGMSELRMDRLSPGIKTIVVDRHLENTELQGFFLAADYCLLPYRNILHSGTALLSATFSCPIIAPRTGFFEDIEKKYQIGLFYEAGSLSELIGTIRVACSGKKNITVEEFRRFHDDHDMKAARDTTIQAYMDLLGERPPEKSPCTTDQ